MTLLRLLVTAGLLWALVTKFDLARVEEIVGHASLPLLAAALLALLAVAPATAARWRIILAAGAPPPEIGCLFKLTLVGWFFNQVLPTGVGGDAVRAWRCHKLGVALGPAIRSVLLDRASGYVVTLLIYAASLPVLIRVLPDAAERIGIVIVFAAGVSGLFALALADFLPAGILRLPFLSALAGLSREGRRLFADSRRCTGVFGLSVLTVGFPVLTYTLLGKSLDTDLSFGTWLLVVPPVTFIQLLPVSFAGWGIRELGMVAILAGFGVQAETALAVSVLFGLSLILVGLPGGLIWLTDWDLRSRTETAYVATTAPARFQDRDGPAA